MVFLAFRFKFLFCEDTRDGTVAEDRGKETLSSVIYGVECLCPLPLDPVMCMCDTNPCIGLPSQDLPQGGRIYTAHLQRTNGLHSPPRSRFKGGRFRYMFKEHYRRGH